MEHYIGFENQFNKIGSDYQSVKQKQKVTKILYLVCNQFFLIHTLKKMVAKVEEQRVMLKFSSYTFLHFINEPILLLKSDRKHTNYIQFPFQVHDTLVETYETEDAQISNTFTYYK